MLTLTHAETIAIACALKDPAVKAAKHLLPDESSESIDITVHIHGTVAKGLTTAGGTRTEPAIVEFGSQRMLLDVMRRCGIGPKRLRETLVQIVVDAKRLGHDAITSGLVQENPRLDDVITDATKFAQSKLPTRSVDYNGRAGAVKVTATIEKLSTVAEPATA